MLHAVINAVHPYATVMHFIAHVIIFVGAFYGAMYNKVLPVLQETPLWYTGLCSLFVAFTILLEWSFGSDFPLSYKNFGLIGEVTMDISLAFLAITMIINTVKQRRAKKLN